MAPNESPNIDEGSRSFIDKRSGKKWYMIGAKCLRIAWHETPEYWQWISTPQSRVKEAAKLRFVWWLEVRGRIQMRLLSPTTTYKAYLVYKLTKRPEEMEYWACEPVVVTVDARPYGFDYERPNLEQLTAGTKATAFLAPRREVEERFGRNHQRIKEAKFPREGRADGWLEVELGEYHCRGDEEGELEMICCEIKSGIPKSGLDVQGIEVRPERTSLLSWI